MDRIPLGPLEGAISRRLVGTLCGENRSTEVAMAVQLTPELEYRESRTSSSSSLTRLEMVADALFQLVDDSNQVARASTGRRTANGLAIVGEEHVDVWTREPGGTWRGDRYDVEWLETPIEDVGRLSAYSEPAELAQVMLERFQTGYVAAA